MELDEFALGESAIGATTGGEGGGAKGLKAAASSAASNLRRNVRSMLTAQQQQWQQQQHQHQRDGSGSGSRASSAWGAAGSFGGSSSSGLSPVCTTASPSSAGGAPTPSTLGGGLIGDCTGGANAPAATSTSTSTSTPVLPPANAFRAASATAGGAGGSSSSSPFRPAAAAGAGDEGGTTAGGPSAKNSPSPVPALGEFPPVSGGQGTAAAGRAGSRGPAASAVTPAGGAVGCGAAAVGNASARVTAPSTPLPGTAPAVPELLEEGDSVEAQFLLADQAVWTTSWYRGEVSAVNVRSGGGDGDGDGVTYGVSFADGDRLDAVPEAHIRLFRGLRVGSVVWVEWPSKGSRPFKGCLTKVCHGDGDGSATFSVIFEDAETEVRVGCRLGAGVFFGRGHIYRIVRCCAFAVAG